LTKSSLIVSRRASGSLAGKISSRTRRASLLASLLSIMSVVLALSVRSVLVMVGSLRRVGRS